MELLESRALMDGTIYTTTTLTISPNPATSDQTVILTAHVTSDDGSGPPVKPAGLSGWGLVTFFVGPSMQNLANAQVDSNGVATYSLTPLFRSIYLGSSTGSISFVASYGGLSGGISDPFYTPSDSDPVIFNQGTTHQFFVQQLYIDLFHRSVDSLGLASWTSALDHGQTYAQVAIAITSSREYDGDVVDAFYMSYLGRHAESFGLNNWIDQMQSGLNAEVIRAGILGSQEYYDRVGGTNTAYVTALYNTFLNRTPEAFGLNNWLAILADPAQRQNVASGISNSDENRTVIITSFYETYLHRAPDAGGLANWKNNLANGISQPQIIAAFVTSPEYFSYNHLS